MSEELYREQTFAERCFCDAATDVRCACCHQPRCAAHLANRLCNRCTQALARVERKRAGLAWWVGGLATVVATIGFIPLASAAAIFIGIGVGAGAGFASHKLQRAHMIATLGRKIPLRGELPAEAREPTFSSSSGTGGLPPGAGPIG